MTDSKQRTKRRVVLAAKFVATLALLYFVWYLVRGDLDEVLTALRSLSIPLLLLALGNHLAGRFLMGWQTSFGMRVHGAFYSPFQLFVINLKTLFFGFFLPGDLSGSAVKWYLISRIEGKRAEALATILYIRLVNLIVVLVTGLGALVMKWPFDDHRLLAYGVAVLILLLGAATAIHLRLTQGLRNHVDAQPLSGLLGGKLKESISKLHDAFLAFSRYGWAEIGTLWGFSVVIKLSVTLSFWLVAQAMGLEISFVSLLWMHSIVEIVQFLPISFSGLGTREIALIYMFQLSGMPETVGLSFSLVLLFLRLVMVGLGGIMAGTSIGGDLQERAAP